MCNVKYYEVMRTPAIFEVKTEQHGRHEGVYLKIHYKILASEPDKIRPCGNSWNIRNPVAMKRKSRQ